MQKNKITILVVDDEVDICNMVSEILKDEGYEVRTANGYNSALDVIEKENITLILTDIWMNNNTIAGIQLLEWSKKNNSLTPVIMMSGHGNIETAMKAAKSGAYDFIEKPFKSERLILLIEKALEERRLKIKILDYETKENQQTELVGNSNLFKNIKSQLEKISLSNSRVLLSGPSGSGKELIARWIHKNSERKNFPFTVASCATLSPERVEEVLFGWDDNSTILNKNESNLGLFEQSNNGTIFFDEICDLPLETQGKLVQVIQDQSFYKIGSNKKITVDVRIISASNKDLFKSIKDGVLREDLYYRLSVVPINIPPLNNRVEDIELLIQHFLKLLSKESGNNQIHIARETLVILQSYEWPGNVRQLKNILEWLIIMYGEQDNFIILPSHLPPEIVGLKSSENIKNINSLEMPLKDARKLFEKNYIKEQLNRFKGNIARTSTYIGMDRSALHRKLKELDINIDDIK
jgi:two-component system nitrogen regulation response regulator NtrX